MNDLAERRHCSSEPVINGLRASDRAAEVDDSLEGLSCVVDQICTSGRKILDLLKEEPKLKVGRR